MVLQAHALLLSNSSRQLVNQKFCMTGPAAGKKFASSHSYSINSSPSLTLRSSIKTFLVLLDNLDVDCLSHKYVDDATSTKLLQSNKKPSNMQSFYSSYQTVVVVLSHVNWPILKSWQHSISYCSCLCSIMHCNPALSCSPTLRSETLINKTHGKFLHGLFTS